MRLILISLVVIFFLLDGAVACNTEDDCPKGHSCTGNICTKCLTCSLLFRKGDFCIVDFKECGDCLEGYEEISVTDFSTVIKPCKLVEKMKFKECLSNNSCPPNNYCSEYSCVQCFNCTLVNRRPPADKCAKGLNECGSCMSGFFEVIVTTDTNYKRCESMRISTGRSFSIWGAAETTLIFAVIVVTTTMFLYMFMVLYKRKLGHSSKSISPGQIIPSAPPFYVLEATENEEGYNPFVSRCAEMKTPFAVLENELKQQAKVFQKPHASYYLAAEEEDEDDDDGRVASDRIPGSNSDTLPSSCATSNSAQSEPSDCTERILTERFVDLAVVDSPDSVLPESSEARVLPANTDSIAMDILNGNQVVEPAAVDETTDTLSAVESSDEADP